LVGGIFGNWYFADEARPMPPTHDSLIPLSTVLLGAALGVILAWISGYLFLAKRFPASDEHS
jgi:hypothetical protein